ncbi:MAG: hypothetical protein MRY83_11760 [Flavobacteriales bacterium]|nr:hypothetical protein [Flavobacteriales bacterium]
MRKTKTIQILSQFSKDEMKKFQLFLNSPFHNKNEKVIKLFGFLFKQYPDFPEKEVSKEKAYKIIYDNGKFDSQKFRLLTSDFFKRLEAFIIHQQLDKDDSLKGRLLLEKYSEFGLLNIFLEQRKSYDKKIAKLSIPSEAKYFNEFRVEEETYEIHSMKKAPESTNNLQNLVNGLDRYFLLLKLKYSCELINRKSILSEEYDFSFLEAIIEYLRENNNRQDTAVNLYFNILLLVRDWNVREFDFLKDEIPNHFKAFTKRELRDMYVFLINFCIRKSNLGQSKYLRELFELYKTLLENEILIESNYMHLYDFKNIATVAIRLGELYWVEEFTNKYSNLINSELKESAIAFNLARVAFYKADYRLALRNLAGVEFSDVYYELGARTLFIKIYYELDDYDLYLAQAHSFNMALSRKKNLSKYQKQIYQNFLLFTKRLLKIKLGDKRKNISKWIDEIANTKEIADRNWLEEKAEELR